MNSICVTFSSKLFLVMLEHFHHHPDSFIVVHSRYFVVALRTAKVIHEIDDDDKEENA